MSQVGSSDEKTDVENLVGLSLKASQLAIFPQQILLFFTQNCTENPFGPLQDFTMRIFFGVRTWTIKYAF